MFNLREVFLTRNHSFSRYTESAAAGEIDFTRTVFGNVGAPLVLTDQDLNKDEDGGLETHIQERLENLEAIPRSSFKEETPFSPEVNMAPTPRINPLEEAESDCIRYGDHGQVLVVEVKYG